MLARILPLSRSNVPTRSTMTRISWATPKTYSRSERLNCLTEMMYLPYQGAERWSPKGRWGFLAGLGMGALLSKRGFRGEAPARFRIILHYERRESQRNETGAGAGRKAAGARA